MTGRGAGCCWPTRQTDPVSEDEDGGQAVCSARGCRASATCAVVWNNPKVHLPDREKLWHACEKHQQSLADYLDVRGFLIRVDPC